MVMTQKNRPIAPSGSSSDTPEGNAEVEQTEVRVTSRRAAPPSSLELMLARAHVVIASMAPADPRARLLQVAMLRRDEILLEALLRRLDAAPPH
jgi:hypothetical protein